MSTLVKVLAILVAIVACGFILFPLCFGHHGGSHTVVCLSNMKQCATAASLYASANNESTMLCPNWMDAVAPYSRSESNFRCPSLKVQGFGYAMSKYASAAKVNQPDADKRPLLFESSELARNASQYLPTYPSPSRHDGKANVSYLDSHARSIRTHESD